jgi:hypothetical protein
MLRGLGSKSRQYFLLNARKFLKTAALGDFNLYKALIEKICNNCNCFPFFLDFSFIGKPFFFPFLFLKVSCQDVNQSLTSEATSPILQAVLTQGLLVIF